MTFEEVRAYLTGLGLGDKVRQFDVSSATVELAAQAVGCEPCRIAKTMSFLIDGAPALIVMAGDARVDNPKFKARFHQKAVMLAHDQVARLTGFPVGGVCPFLSPAPVYLDESLRRFAVVYPAAGSPNSAVELTLEELQAASRAAGWVDVSRLPASADAPSRA